MQYREFGRTGFRLSYVGLGGLLDHYWEGEAGVAPPKEKRRIYLRAHELGINLFDMGYGDHVHIPDELKGPHPDRYFSLKVGGEAGALESKVDDHLAVIRRDAVDILRVHYCAFMETEALREAVAVLRQKGKVRSLCLIRHFEPDQVAYASRGPESEAESDLVIYNYVCRHQEAGIELSTKVGKGVLIMKALGGQYLSWQDKNKADWSGDSAETLIKLSPLGESMRHELSLVDAFTTGPWNELADPGQKVARTGPAVAWVLQNQAVSSTYVAVASVAELEAALECV